MPDPTEEAGSREQGAGARGQGVRQQGESGLLPHSLTPSLPHSLPETPTPTPGQVAYTAYLTALPAPHPASPMRPLWETLPAVRQAAWEAAAQAVRAWQEAKEEP